MSYENDDKLKEHDIIQKIKNRHDISNLSLTHINGYVADSPIKDCVRLFTTLNFDICVDIPKNTIIHVEEVSKDIMEFGGTCIWVSNDAELTYTRIERSKIEARFIEGKIMRDYLRFAKDLDFENLLQGRMMESLLEGCGTLECSRHCPSQYATCRSQCETCPA